MNQHEEEHNDLLMRTGRCFSCGETLDDTVPMTAEDHTE